MDRAVAVKRQQAKVSFGRKSDRGEGFRSFIHHEGFGMPPLEAMACRTLAITSNTTSLPEVMGNSGIMLDPTREVDWVESLLKIAGGGGDRDSMIERGLDRVRKFSWKSTVDRHLVIYGRLAS